MCKRRFELDRGGYRVEVDAYADALEGLVTAEVEFDSEDESAAFDLDDLGREMTGDARYANQRLAIDGAPAEESR